MIHMIIRETCHGEVAVIVVRLKSDIDTLLLSNLLGRLDEVLR